MSGYGPIEDLMKKSLEKLQNEFSFMRTGRANAALLEGIKAEYYGNLTPIQQLANVSVVEGRSLEIKPWDKEGLTAIEQAILKSGLGITPQSDGKVLRIIFPAPTMERRHELVKVIRRLAEEFRVTVRNIRRDAVEELKKREKEKKITQDDLRRSEQEVQKLTDQYVKNIDSLLAKKEAEVMTI